MRRIHFLALSLLCTSLLFSACKDDDDNTEDVNCSTFEWESEKLVGTDKWPTCFLDCAGQSQSPINIKDAVTDESLAALEVQYDSVPIDLINKGYTLEFEYGAGSTLKLNDEDYKLLQFHFHTKSEHTVNGEQYPMEVHLVHQNEATGNLAVIGLFFEEGNENAFLKNFTDNLPMDKDEHFTADDEVNVADLLPNTESYYTYSGSLTTPPCSETVTWLVLKTPVEASAAQIQSMYSIMADNYRPVQPLNGRTIKSST